MGETLSTLSGIASHIASSFVLPVGVSGNLIQIVDLERQNVSNYVGLDIGSNSISDKYQPVIVNFSKAQALNEAFSWASTLSSSGTAMIASGSLTSYEVKLAELTIQDEASPQQISALKALEGMSKDTPNQFRQMALYGLKNLGRAVSLSKSLS
jgi:hypothetical protein